MMRSARPKVVIPSARRGLLGVLLLELRGTLGHEAVALRDEAAVPERALDDHLAALAEGIRHLARVPDRHRCGAVAVADLEEQRLALVAHRVGRHGARQLVGAPGLAVGEQLRWLARLGRRAE